MTFNLKNPSQPLVALSILAALAGLAGTGCSSNTEAVVVKPATAADRISERTKNSTEDNFSVANGKVDNNAVDERQLMLDTPTDAEITYEGIVLPRVIPGLTVGMPYAEARILILADGWRPASGLQPASRNGMDDYMEIEDCSGSGLGLCSMSFVDAQMNRFGLTTWGSEPTVRDWGDVW